MTGRDLKGMFKISRLQHRKYKYIYLTMSSITDGFHKDIGQLFKKKQVACSLCITVMDAVGSTS